MEFLGSLEEWGEEWGTLMSLEKFKVTAGRFASVPPWIDGLEHLAFLQITVCNNAMASEILDRLPNAMAHFQHRSYVEADIPPIEVLFDSSESDLFSFRYQQPR